MDGDISGAIHIMLYSVRLYRRTVLFRYSLSNLRSKIPTLSCLCEMCLDIVDIYG